MNTLLAEKSFPSGQMLQLAHGDITLESVDAIVNAANRYLHHGGGVAWAIVRRGGVQIQEESDAWIRKHGLVTHERPAWTHAGQLPARYVIHAVGPVWGEGEEDEKLRKAIRGSLQVAEELGCQSMALPAISTGIFGFPKERAARILFDTMVSFFEEHPSSLKLVRIVLWDRESVEVFLQVWRQQWPE